MMDEVKLIEKLRLIEALFSGATTEGGRKTKHSIESCLFDAINCFQREMECGNLATEAMAG
jgi:hypothetical protein